jgi:hypothetical protein
LSSVTDWLLDADPAIRWQVGAALLGLQADDGRWDGGTYLPGWVDDDKPFFDAWTATHFVLQELRELGLDPDSPEARRAIGLVRDNVRWWMNGARYFVGEVEPCVNGLALANGAYFGQQVDGIVERLLAGRLPDGGWNCWVEFGATVSSFHSTICVLEGLLAWERAGGSSTEVTEARRRGEEYLLERRLFRRRSTGEVADPRFTLFSYPTRWYYDVLRGLDYFRATDEPPDDRCAEAIDLVAARRDASGRWPLENVHQGPIHFSMESPEGAPSRWNTLRALRVLRWAGRGADAA